MLLVPPEHTLHDFPVDECWACEFRGELLLMLHEILDFGPETQR